MRLRDCRGKVSRIELLENSPAGRASVPGRLVVSAKSWLCHPGVDRSARILPWGASEEVPRLSPVAASACLLRHMAMAWNAAHPNDPLALQEVVITVPASFDEVARSLTVKAASEAGLEKFNLLEEPQAAFYDFTARHRQELAKILDGIAWYLWLMSEAGLRISLWCSAGSARKGLCCAESPLVSISCWAERTWMPP